MTPEERWPAHFELMPNWSAPDPATLEQPATIQDPWRARQKRYFEQYPKRCVICQASDAVHLHHRHYRDPRGSELDRTLVALCALHHRQVHRWHDKVAKHDELPYRWLSIVTSFAILALKVGGWLRHPPVLIASTVAAVWWVGLWLPIVALVVMVAGGPAVRSLKKLKPT